jgi:hypothetical protein
MMVDAPASPDFTAFHPGYAGFCCVQGCSRVMLKENILNFSEFRTKRLLEKVLDLFEEKFFNCPQFSMSQVIDPKDPSLSSEERDYCFRGNFDFLVAKGDQGMPIMAVEFDGPMHRTEPRKRKNDTLKNSICCKAGLPLLRIGGEDLNAKEEATAGRTVDIGTAGFSEYAIWYVIAYRALADEERRIINKIAKKRGYSEEKTKAQVAEADAWNQALAHVRFPNMFEGAIDSVQERVKDWKRRMWDTGLQYLNSHGRVAFDPEIRDAMGSYNTIRHLLFGSPIFRDTKQFIYDTNEKLNQIRNVYPSVYLDRFWTDLDRAPVLIYRRNSGGYINAELQAAGFSVIRNNSVCVTGIGLDTFIPDNIALSWHARVLSAKLDRKIEERRKGERKDREERDQRFLASLTSEQREQELSRRREYWRSEQEKARAELSELKDNPFWEEDALLYRKLKALYWKADKQYLDRHLPES